MPYLHGLRWFNEQGPASAHPPGAQGHKAQATQWKEDAQLSQRKHAMLDYGGMIRVFKILTGKYDAIVSINESP